MYHHMEFDPYLIRERNQQLFNRAELVRFLLENRRVASSAEK
jgi:hypothetical protein